MASRKGLIKTRHPGVYRREKDGVYAVYVGVRVGGKVKHRTSTLPNGATVEDAIRRAAEVREALRAPETVGHPQQVTSPVHAAKTVEDYAHTWLDAKKTRLRPSTYKMYEDAMMKRVLPRLGHMLTADICRTAVEAWVGWLESQVQPSGNRYTQPTLRSWWRVGATMLRDLSADLDLADPTRRVRPPESSAPAVREQETLTREQLDTFLTAVKQFSPDRFAEVAVLAYTGMRAGELYGLRWDAVDYNGERIEIRRAVSKGELIESTKTKADRVVPLHPKLAAVLQEHRTKMLKAQHRGLATGLLFPSDRGGVRVPQSLPKVFALGMAAAKLEIKVGPQVLRRTFNTLMTLAGVDRITLRAMMGHTSEEMTERYAGIPLAAKRAALDAIFG